MRTPYLDALAMQGAHFNRAYSAVPTCIASRAALHTGLSQRAHRRVGYQDKVPWDYPVTMAGEFSRHGYQTRAVGKMHVYPARYRLGFDEVDLHDGFLPERDNRDVRVYDDYLAWLRNQIGQDSASDYAEHGVDCNAVTARPWDKPERLHPTNWVVTKAIDFLYRRDPTAPFFCFLSFYHPHPPYVPPAWAFEQYLGAPHYEPPVGDWAAGFEKFRQDWWPNAFVAHYDSVTLQRARAGYYGHLTHIDLQINRFRRALEDFGVADNTWICFVSDHGEQLGDHHLFRKGPAYEGSARVPLILNGPPGALPGGASRDEVVELRDVMPTLLDCAGLPIPDHVQGRSVLPLAGGRRVPWREYLHGEHTLYGTLAGQSMHWLTDGRYKYVWFSEGGHEQLFDLQEDPQERHDISDLAVERLRQWHSRLVEELRGRPEGYVSNDRLVPGRPPVNVLPLS